MRTLLRFAGWATVTFLASWWIAGPYQHVVSTIAARIVSPRGDIDAIDLEVFFPFDLGIYVALCAASAWVRWRPRLRAIAIGLPVLVAAEVLTLVLVIVGMLVASKRSPGEFEAMQRLAIAAVRVTGLVAAACMWLWLLGREPMARLVGTLSSAARAGGGRR